MAVIDDAISMQFWLFFYCEVPVFVQMLGYCPISTRQSLVYSVLSCLLITPPLFIICIDVHDLQISNLT